MVRFLQSEVRKEGKIDDESCGSETLNNDGRTHLDGVTARMEISENYKIQQIEFKPQGDIQPAQPVSDDVPVLVPDMPGLGDSKGLWSSSPPGIG